jgi:hypothetical protein
MNYIVLLIFPQAPEELLRNNTFRVKETLIPRQHVPLTDYEEIIEKYS